MFEQNNIGGQQSSRIVTEAHNSPSSTRPQKRTLGQTWQENLAKRTISTYKLNNQTSSLIEIIREEKNFKGFLYEEGTRRGQTSLIIYSCNKCIFSTHTLRAAAKHKHLFKMRLGTPASTERKEGEIGTMEIGIIPMLKIENKETNYLTEGNGYVQEIICPICHNEIGEDF